MSTPTLRLTPDEELLIGQLKEKFNETISSKVIIKCAKAYLTDHQALIAKSREQNQRIGILENQIQTARHHIIKTIEASQYFAEFIKPPLGVGGQTASPLGIGRYIVDKERSSDDFKPDFNIEDNDFQYQTCPECGADWDEHELKSQYCKSCDFNTEQIGLFIK